MPLGCPASCNQAFQSIHESIGLSDRSSDRSSLIPARRKTLDRSADRSISYIASVCGWIGLPTDPGVHWSVDRPIQWLTDRSADRSVSFCTHCSHLDRSADQSMARSISIWTRLLLYADGSVYRPIQEHTDRSVDRSSGSLIGRLTDQWASVLSVRTWSGRLTDL